MQKSAIVPDAVVFDLDDTLTFTSVKARTSVPKQTFHLLKKLTSAGIATAVISANPLARNTVVATGLSRYVQVVVQERDVDSAGLDPDLAAGRSESERVRLQQLVKAVTTIGLEPAVDRVLYVDDGLRHLANIKKAFPNTALHHCDDALKLHLIWHTHFESKKKGSGKVVTCCSLSLFLFLFPSSLQEAHTEQAVLELGDVG